MDNAPNFYDVIEELDHLEDKSKPKVIGHTPDLIDFEKELKPSKGFFSLALSDDDLSSDEESESSAKIAQMEKLGTFPFTRPSIAPSLSLEFPVAPSSPELEPKEEPHFTFLDRGLEFSDPDTGNTGSPARNCPSPEVPIPTGFNSDRPGGNDPVTVTLTFRNGLSDKANIEQALNAISNIIGYNIVDYKMEPDPRKPKDAPSANQKPSNLPDVVPKSDSKKTNHITCKKCSQPIFKENGAKPIHPKNHPEQTYCTMSCMKIDQATRDDNSPSKSKKSEAKPDGDKKGKVKTFPY